MYSHVNEKCIGKSQNTTCFINKTFYQQFFFLSVLRAPLVAYWLKAWRHESCFSCVLQSSVAHVSDRTDTFVLINAPVYTVTFHWRRTHMTTTQNEEIQSLFSSILHT